jgi:hypothetical protein
VVAVSGFPSLLLVLWAMVTVVFAVLSIYKQKITRIDESLILNPAEASQAADLRQAIERVERLGVWVKCLGYSSLVLLLFGAGLSVYRAMSN